MDTYEKKYNEAMLRADEAVQKGCLDKDMFDIIFPPEESEDERIRKTLREYVKNRNWPLNGPTQDEVLAWLEKQKELERIVPERDATDFEIEVHEIIAQARSDKRLANKDVLERFEQEAACALMWKAEKQKEQKPAWSEEDEKIMNTMIKDGDLKPSEIQWLKSLRPQPHKEIYQAAKRDLAIKFMNYLDENRPEGKMSLSNGECEDIDKAFKENDWAKIMRYVEKYSPSWKPSEEQIYSLGTVVKGAGEASVGSIGYNLKELYEHLKKLI